MKKEFVIIFTLICIIYFFPTSAKADGWPEVIYTAEPEGAARWQLSKDYIKEKLIKQGDKIYTADWSDWTDRNDCDVLVCRYRKRPWKIIQTWETRHYAEYTLVDFGRFGTSTYYHTHGDQYNTELKGEDEETDWEVYIGCIANIPDLRDNLVATKIGREDTLYYSGDCPQIAQGMSFTAPLNINIPNGIVKTECMIDDLTIRSGESILLTQLGWHNLIIKFYDELGGKLLFLVPFNVVIPLQIEQITEKVLKEGIVQYDLKFQNNTPFSISMPKITIPSLDTLMYFSYIGDVEQLTIPSGAFTQVSIYIGPSGLWTLDEVKTIPKSSIALICSSMELPEIIDTINLIYNLGSIFWGGQLKHQQGKWFWGELDAGYFIPMDKSARSLYGNGIIFNGSLGFSILPKFLIKSNISYWKKSKKESLFDGEINHTMRTIPLTISGEYFVSIPKTKISFFTGLGAGVNFANMSNEGSYHDPHSYDMVIVSENESKIVFECDGIIGADYLFIHQLAVNVEIRYSYTLPKAWDMNLGGISIQGGIKFFPMRNSYKYSN